MTEIVHSSGESSTPYDDIVRTLLHDSAGSIIPVVNHMFGKEYSNDAEVTTYTTEHVSKRADGKVVRRNSDLHFAVTENGRTDVYHYEVQAAPDGSILMRFFEYDTQMALERRERAGPFHERYRLPNSALICLRSYGGRPKEMRYTVVTSETEADHVIPVMSMADTTVSELIEGDLFFLLPFFLFCHVKELEKIEKSPERLEELFAEERRIAEFYASLAKTGRLTAAELGLFLEMTKRAVQNLALEQPQIKEGTEKIMGGQILSYATKEAAEKAAEKAAEIASAEGMKQGANSQLVSLVQEMKSKGMSFDVVMDIALAGTPLLSPAEVRAHVAAVYELPHPGNGSEPNGAAD